MKKLYATIAAIALVIGGLQFSALPASAVDFTLAEVQTHNTAADCWTIVGGNVYNLTSFIAAHPGGVGSISGICGVDGTAAFTAIHGSSATAQAALASLLIGTLSVPDAIAPSVPTGLAASVISSSRIDLSWTASTDNVGVTGYNIYRDGVLVASSSVNSFSNTGLVASTTYSFRVAAFDAAGNLSAQSLAVSATTLAVPANVDNDEQEDADEHDGTIEDEHEDQDQEDRDDHDGIHEDEHEDDHDGIHEDEHEDDHEDEDSDHQDDHGDNGNEGRGHVQNDNRGESDRGHDED